MSSILIGCLLLLTVQNNAYSADSTFEILRGTLHKGGSLEAHGSAEPQDRDMRIEMHYEIKAKGFVPVPSKYLAGDYEQTLPAQFKSTDGYLELERVKSIKITEAKIVHLGRTTWNGFNDAHRVHIIPDNGKSELLLTYHPKIPGLGWDDLQLILHTGVPLLGDYEILGKLKK